MTTYLSPHFSLEEMVQSQTASREGLDNTPPPEVLTNLTATAQAMEPVRELLGCAILVSSGYRSPAVNAAVGGVPTSAHTHGYAVDFMAPAFGDPIDVCRAIAASSINYDQCIEECTWIHISFAPTMRRELLTKTATGYAGGIPT